MARLFAVGSLLVDVAGSLASLVGDGDSLGTPLRIEIGMFLFALPLAIRIAEPLWLAMFAAPEVLEIDILMERNDGVPD
jgi:hypothetical protein